MRIILNPWHHDHVPPHEVDHGTVTPACDVPGRVDAVLRALVGQPWATVEDAAPLAEDTILELHTPDYITYLRETSAASALTGTAVYPAVFPYGPNSRTGRGKGARGAYCFDTFTPITAGTFRAALGGAAAAWRAADCVTGGEQAVYVLTRPPGHHAEASRCGGYSYINNAALVAERLSRSGPVAVLDVDAHHGNGTQHLFYDRPDILVTSIHGDPAGLFPYFSGYTDETGRGPGLGYNRNLPLAKGATERDYRPALALAIDLVAQHRPAFVVISFGADTHERDPIGGFALPTDYFRVMGSSVRQLGTPVVVVQEGGYNLDVIGDCVVGFLAGLLNTPVASR